MRRSRSKATFCIVLAMALWTPESGLADQPPTLTLQDFMSLALKHNPGVVASQAQRDAARAGERTAAAYPNPVIEAGAGPSLYRDGRDGVDSNWAFGVSQPIDYPALRSYRIRGAAGRDRARPGWFTGLSDHPSRRRESRLLRRHPPSGREADCQRGPRPCSSRSGRG